MLVVDRLKAADDVHDPMQRYGIWTATINLTTAQLLPRHMWTDEVLMLAERAVWNISTSEVPRWVSSSTTHVRLLAHSTSHAISLRPRS